VGVDSERLLRWALADQDIEGGAQVHSEIEVSQLFMKVMRWWRRYTYFVRLAGR
jgi:hypothetical protein